MRNIIIVLLAISCLFNVQGQEKEFVEPAFDFLFDFPNSRDFTLSSSGDEAYLTLQSPLEEIAIIAVIKKMNGHWSEPKKVSFTGRYRDIEPFLVPDELRLYFASNRPLNDSISEAKDFDIWYVDRESVQDDWSEPKNMGAPINTEHGEFYASVSNSGNMYFTSDRPNGSKGKDDIYVSIFNGDSYTNPISLEESINTSGYEYNAYIAPDESYLLYGAYNREGGLGSGDLYVSYRQDDGTWGTSKNLGDGFNSKYMDYCPFVDNNSNTLYFTSRRSEMQQESFKSIDDFRGEINKYANGFSRIYKVPFNPE